MNIAFVRGAYLNNFEGQNYVFNSGSIRLTAIASKHSIHTAFPFEVRRLWSTTDVGLPSFIANRTLGDAQILVGLEKLSSHFDIFHTADPHYYYSYQLALLRAHQKIPFLLSTSWETIPFNNETVRQKKYIKTFAKKYIDHFLCYTNRAKQCLTTEGIDPKKITVIPLGVDIKKFKPFKKNQQYKKIQILFTGRYVSEKGVDDLPQIMSHLPNAELILAHNIPYEQMPHYYQQADIFIMPSKMTPTWEEQYGMSMVEAMACGLPIVAYNSGAIPEVLGNAGILINEGDIHSFAQALQDLITHQDRRKKLGRMSEERAKKQFDASKTTQKIQKLYETIYSNSRKK